MRCTSRLKFREEKVDLHKLIEEFSKLENAVVGHGPKHPERLDRKIAKQLSDFLIKYPAFAEDKGIVEYFEYYGAIGIHPPNPPFDKLTVITYGFDEEITMSIAHPDESLEDNGFYRFAEVIVVSSEYESTDAEYAINIEHSDKKGIYHRVSSGDFDSRKVAYTPYCATFLDWLDKLIKNKGKYL